MQYYLNVILFMKIKFFKKIVWLLALVLGLTACKKNNPHGPIDPYAPVTEGKIFLPVLTHKPDMNKVKEIEKGRKGKFVEKKSIDVEEVNYEEHVFSYTDMDVQTVSYIIETKSGLLYEVRLKIDGEEKSSKIAELVKKQGFNSGHIFAGVFGRPVREREDAIFYVDYNKAGKTFNFFQVGKQPSPKPTLSELPDQEYMKYLLNKDYSFDKIKEEEEKGKSSEFLEAASLLVQEGKNKGKVEFALFKLNESNSLPMVYRGYGFIWDDNAAPERLGQCQSLFFLYQDYSLAFYLDELSRNILPTKEFYNLCRKAGYEFKFPDEADSEAQSPVVLYNTKKRLRLAADIKRDSKGHYLWMKLDGIAEKNLVEGL